MKIAMADNCGLKFCEDLMNHWITNGHEVKYERGASEHLAQWADIYYVDWSDNNIHYLRDLYNGDPRNCRTKDWDNNRRPTFVVRTIDWDVWIGHARDQSLIDWVDKWICIAPHIEAKLRAEGQYRQGQLKCIRPGVNLDKFTLKTKQTDGFQLGMVLGDMWWYKNHMAGLDIFTSLYQKDNRWRLHIRGQHEPGEYNPVMYDYYLESRGIKNAVTLYPSQPNMNEWYENIDILLAPGMKEAFCYAAAEAMAKGIPAMINDFYGSNEIWTNITYQTHQEAIENIELWNKIYLSKVESLPEARKRIRLLIEEKYDMKRQFKETDEYLGL